MRAVLLLAKARLRRNVGATVVLIMVLGLAGGVALAGFAGARRTDAAVPAFIRFNRGADAYAFFPPVTEDGTPTDLGMKAAAISAFPGVRLERRFTNGIVSATDPTGPGGRRRLLVWIGIDPGSLSLMGRPMMISGRLPRDQAADEIAIDEELARDAGLQVGSQYRLRAYTVGQLEDVGEAAAPPLGLEVTARVVGIIRQPFD